MPLIRPNNSRCSRTLLQGAVALIKEFVKYIEKPWINIKNHVTICHNALEICKPKPCVPFHHFHLWHSESIQQGIVLRTVTQKPSHLFQRRKRKMRTFDDLIGQCIIVPCIQNYWPLNKKNCGKLSQERHRLSKCFKVFGLPLLLNDIKATQEGFASGRENGTRQDAQSTCLASLRPLRSNRSQTELHRTSSNF